jgi:MerC mercury resistance protein
MYLKFCNTIAFIVFLQPYMATKINWDAMGIITSIACAIHCALLPVLITSLPLFGIDIIHNLFFEWSMIVLAFAVGIYALLHGYIKHHQAVAPLAIFTIGFILLLLKQVFHQQEFLFLTPAVVCIIGAHYYNYTLCHKSKCSSPHHKH